MGHQVGASQGHSAVEVEYGVESQRVWFSRKSIGVEEDTQAILESSRVKSHGVEVEVEVEVDATAGQAPFTSL